MAVVASNSKAKKELNFELNLMPVIDILTVCICFMLMTVVWMQVGALQAAQSMGGQPKIQAPNPASVWAHLNPRGEVVLTLRDVPGRERFAREIKLKGLNGNMDWQNLTLTIGRIQKHVPSIKTALIMPSEHTQYDDIVQLMSQLKNAGIKSVGISPL